MKHYISSITFLIFSIKLLAITNVPPIKPTIIINLVLDNVSNEEIDRNSHLLTQDGLLKLRNEGSTFHNAYYPYASNDRACDYASISTGTTPRYHGIVADKWLTNSKAKIESSISNEQIHVLDSFSTKPGYNANKLRVTTIGDELKLNTMGKAKVFSVSLDKYASVLLGGHAANAAYWMDNKTGDWVTSSSYMEELPKWVNDFNEKKFSNFYLEQEWVLSGNITKSAIGEEAYSNHTFPLTLNNYIDEDFPYSIISSTPMGQLLVEDFTKEVIKNENLGKDDNTDILYINYSSITNPQIKTGKYSIEKADFLVRLDKSIAKLINYLDDEIGSHRYLIALTSTKQVGANVDELKKYKIPTGYFNPTRAQALLNSYLMAVHGQGNWILNIKNQQIYLNKELIEKSHLNINDFSEQVALFMEEFSGIKWALPASKLKYSDFKDENFIAIQASYFPSRSGDIVLCYFPGWAEESKDKTSKYTYSHNNSAVPLMFYGWKTKRSNINTKACITGLAPTLSTLINISIPNSSSKNQIFEELNEK